MKAVTVTPGVKDSASLCDLERPEPRVNEILAKTLMVGIDGTDREIDEALYGKAPKDSEALIIGHEAVGIVEEPAGDLEEGDIIVPTVRRHCPQHCLNCRNNEMDMCVTGDYLERGIKGLHGFMSEYFTADQRYVVPLPLQLRDVAVLLEPLSVVEKVVNQVYRIQKRMAWAPQRVLVLGAGPIGLLASMILRLKCLDVHTLDIVPKDSVKAGIVKKIGAEYIDGNTMDITELSTDIGNIDIIIEATGDSTVAFNALKALGMNGVMCLTSLTGGNRRLDICSDCVNMDFVLGNRILMGSVNSNIKDFYSGIEHMQEIERKWPGVLASMLTKKVPLENFRDAFKKGPEDIKSVVVFR